MRSIVKFITSLLTGGALLAGCQSGPYLPKDTAKNTLEHSEKFVLMDRPTQRSVTCIGLKERKLADGRLEIQAEIKNRETRRIQVQVRCVFRSEDRFSTGDETPWQTLILGENATETVQFASMNAAASEYTVAVRQAR